MADKKMEEAWEKANSLIEKDEFDKALDLLRDIDLKGKESRTWHLAGDAKLGLARESSASKPVGLYRQARNHYREAIKIDPSSKASRSALDSLLNEMQNNSISETKFPVLYKDGTPTMAGLIGIPLIVLGAFAILKIVSENGGLDFYDNFFSNDDDGEVGGSGDYMVEMDISWTEDGASQSGTIIIELYYDDAPIHVQNFVELTENGNYDGTIFHRIIDGFMVQGGDFTNGDGTGGHAASWQGYCNGEAEVSSSNCPETSWTIPDEANNGRIHVPYALSMAKTSAPHTGGSQFFIVDGGSSPSHLDGVHTVFGQVVSGTEVVDSISQVSVGQGDVPNNAVTITDAKLIPL
ncbi:MAG: peptidylprolyl isomerase [Euryarchaeota archaeon]|jgi:cyclophilin family peptidyl-prolyl cis-trans isomerase|nr:peptidylprolyl isomerase [Euryarchaeota archaeon]MBT3971277.1 peptidylprolyl isomerase [Euryarchaeota archaeon]MBT4407084.1 peptidylprolyl isomerase [Euryarchaeota archaeon]